MQGYQESSPPVADGGESPEERDPIEGGDAFAESLRLSREHPFEATRRALETEHARELAARDARLAGLQDAYRSALKDRELATALADKPLLPGAAAQLVKLWREDLEVVEDEGRYRVASTDGRGVAEAVAEWLSRPEYGHFCRPSSRGGSATRGPERPSTAAAGRPARNLGEAIVMRWQQEAPRPADAAAPIGLGRRR